MTCCMALLAAGNSQPSAPHPVVSEVKELSLIERTVARMPDLRVIWKGSNAALGPVLVPLDPEFHRQAP